METRFGIAERVLKLMALVTLVFTVSSVSNFAQAQAPAGVPEKAYKQAMDYLSKYPGSFKNKNYMVIIDFTKHKSKKRFHLIDLKTKKVQSYLTSHGKGSDRNGYAKIFSNVARSKASSEGFYRTGGTYYSKKFKGTAMKLQGLSKTNSNAFARVIVVHPARYVSEKHGNVGNSWGCPALDPKVSDSVIKKVKGGSLMFIWRG